MMEVDLIQLDSQGRLHRGSGISFTPLQMNRRNSPSKESVGKIFYVNGSTQTVFDNITFSSFVTLRTTEVIRNN